METGHVQQDRKGMEGYYHVYEVRIRNFKSIKDARIPLKPGINVLVGRNASGKTNILEAIYFLYKSLVSDRGKTPYRPHAGLYWSGLDAIYMKQQDLDVELGLGIIAMNEVTEANDEETCAWTIDFSVIFNYDPAMDTLKPVAHIYIINNDTKIEIRNDGITVNISRRVYDMIPDNVRKNIYENVKELKININKNNISYNISYINNVYDHIRDRVLVDQLYKHFIISEGRPIDNNIIIENVLLPFTNIKAPIIYKKCLTIDQENKVFNYKYLSRKCGQRFSDAIPCPSLGCIFGIVDSVLGGIVLLKHPDMGVISRPVPFRGERRLDVRASNLADVLLAYQGMYGGLPPRVRRILEKVFPGVSVRVMPVGGNVVLVGYEDGMELPPANLPDGLIKAVAIGVAMDLGASLLLADEIENSMHAELLEVLFDEANNYGSPVIVSTHSPIVVDLAGPERVLIVSRGDDGSTRVERVSGDLTEVLAREGVALSDHIFYGATRRQGEGE